MKKIFKQIAVVLTLGFSTGVFAGESALYDAEAPPTSAFIRVFNSSTGSELSDVQLGEKTISKVKPVSASSYIYLLEGNHKFVVGDKSLSLDLKKGHFYTLTNLGSELKVIEDKPFDSKKKSMVSFYNFLNENGATLATADGKLKVVEDVKYQKNGFREINPVRVSLTAMVDGNKVGSPQSVSLERGRVFSFFACGTKASPVLVKVENNIDTSI